MNEPALAALFRRITHGVYVIGVADGYRQNAFTAAWVMQVSFRPLLLALSINRGHKSYDLLRNGRCFTVNVLRRDQLELAKHFAQPSISDKLSDSNWRPAQSGAPILSDTAAYFDCELLGEYPAGDHILAVGRVLDGAILDDSGPPMNYLDTGDMDGAEAIYRTLSIPSR